MPSRCERREMSESVRPSEDMTDDGADSGRGIWQSIRCARIAVSMAKSRLQRTCTTLPNWSIGQTCGWSRPIAWHSASDAISGGRRGASERDWCERRAPGRGADISGKGQPWTTPPPLRFFAGVLV